MKKIDPRKLFPTVSLESISNDNILFFLNKLEKKEDIMPVMVYYYEDNYYIIDGHHRMLSTVIYGKEEIEIVELQKSELPNWWTEKLFEDTLSSLGMRTIYDFEAIGNFSYYEYPYFYKR